MNGETKNQLGEQIDITQKKIEKLIDNFTGEIALFLGAGASVTADIPTMKELSKKVLEKNKVIIDKQNYHNLIELIYRILCNENKGDITIEQIMEILYQLYYIKHNREKVLNINLEDLADINEKDLLSAIRYIKKIIIEECNKINKERLYTHFDFFKCVLTDSPRLSNLFVFTTNYDLLIEFVCDNLKYKCVDGFIGKIEEFEDFESFDEKVTGRIGKRKTIFLHKLHGSVNWIIKDGLLTKENRLLEALENVVEYVLIYPTPSKFKEVLGYPYFELINRLTNFLDTTNHPKLLVIGYGFPDNHINDRIKTYLERNKHFTLFIVDPYIELETLSSKLGTDCIKDNRIVHIKLSFEEFTKKFLEISKNE